MNDYVIGSGAVLSAGPNAAITGVCLHAQTDASIASRIRAAVVDFEASRLSELSRVVVVGSGWNASRVRSDLVAPLLERRACTLADVAETLARAAATEEVHFFARWMPDEFLVSALQRGGIVAVAHPLEAIRQAALVCGQKYSRWPSPLRAA
jgi:hypothetical protein